MQKNKRLFIFAILAVLVLAACGGQATSSTEHGKPSENVLDEDTGRNRVILKEDAANRIGLETAPIQSSGSQMTIPYSAIIYDLTGETWVYVTVDTLTYTRQPVTVENIDDDTAILSDGPDVGTEVVIVGVAELYGADTGVGK